MWEEYRLHQRNHWIFDLDGTLTISAHDFVAIREKLGLDADVPILEALNAMPGDNAGAVSSQLASIRTIINGIYDVFYLPSRCGVGNVKLPHDESRGVFIEVVWIYSIVIFNTLERSLEEF